MKDSLRIVVGIASLNRPGTMGSERSTLQSRKGFRSISEEDPSVGGTKSKVSDSRFGSTTCVSVLLHLLCTSCSGLSTSGAKPACYTVEVC